MVLGCCESVVKSLQSFLIHSLVYELYDLTEKEVKFVEEGQVIPEKLLYEMQKEEYYRCPECKGKKLTVWNPRYRKCPKCNGRMLLDKTEYPMLWD